MKKYKVTVNSSLLNEERPIEIEAIDPQDAHKEVMFSEGFDLTFDQVVEIRNSSGILVYGTEGFVNADRDLETTS
jgi:hypothetical protein